MESMLVVVIDGSKKLSRYWDDIKTVLESIVRNFCANHASNSSDLFGGRYNLNLVINAPEDGLDAQSAPQLDWPHTMDSFLDSLSRLNFNDYGYLDNSGVIEGISKALMMFPSTRKRKQTELMGKRHCVLVTASHPYPCPKEVLIPTNQVLESGEVVEVTIDTVLADAETMARSLAESFISLSVICPSDMPMTKTIYDAGNPNSGSFTISLKHPQLLLLISEQFPEAREALKQFEPKNNDDTNSQLDLFDLITEDITVEDLMLLQNMISDPSVEQPDDTVPMAPEGAINEVVINPCLEGNVLGQMWLPDILEDASWPLGTSIAATDVIVCNNSTMQQGSSSTMQQESLGNYLHDQRNEAEGSIWITPQEKEGLNTLIPDNLWLPNEAPSSFSQRSIGLNPVYGQDAMSNLLNPPPNDGLGQLIDMEIPKRLAIDSTCMPCQQTVPKANTTFNWLEKYDPNQMLTSPSCNALTTVNISQHLEGGAQNPPVLNLQHPVASLLNARSGTRSTSSSAFGSPASDAYLVGSNGTLNSKMPPEFPRSISATMGGASRSSKKPAKTKNAQATGKNASRKKYVSRSTQTINFGSTQTQRNDVMNASHMRDVVLSTKPPIPHLGISGTTKDVISTNTPPILPMSTSTRNVALHTSSSSFKQPRPSRVVPLHKPKNAKPPRAQSADRNPPQNNLSSEAPSDYIKVWEGSLASRGSGVALFESKIVAYRMPTTPEKIFENWPKVMKLKHLVSLTHMSTSPIRANRQYLAFSVLDTCPTLEHMKSDNLCAYIDVPGHTLILWISPNKTRLMGMLCDGVIPVDSHLIFKPNW